MQGTAGPEVRWGAGYRGFLTAGHVVTGHANVTDGGTPPTVLGTTVHVLDPAITSSGSAPDVDVALMRVGASAVTTTFSMGSPLASGTTSIDLHLGSGLKSSSVLGMIAWYIWPGIGRYVDLYMTNAACTAPGDSGAIVTTAGSNDAIGIVVGGTTTFSSFIQDIQTQITALRTVAGLGTLSL
jgi:hypothetical protein